MCMHIDIIAAPAHACSMHLFLTIYIQVSVIKCSYTLYYTCFNSSKCRFITAIINTRILAELPSSIDYCINITSISNLCF